MEKGTLGLIVLAILAGGMALLFLIGPIFFSGEGPDLAPVLDENAPSESEDTSDEALGDTPSESPVNPEDSNNNETNMTEEPINEVGTIDLYAFNLTLIDNGCTEYTNSTTNETYNRCDMNITGVIKNSGTLTVTEDFFVYFDDITNEPTIIHVYIPKITDDLSPGQEKEISINYGNLTRGTYKIVLEIDQLNLLKEEDRTNNLVWGSVRL